MPTPKESALEMIQKQLLALEQIYNVMVETQNWALIREKLERWRERTSKLIAEQVSLEEANRFSKHKIPHYTPILPLDDFRWLKGSINKFASLLTVLNEELLQPQGESLIKIETNILQNSTTERINQIMPDSKRVFIVYGRNAKAKDAMVLFLRAIGLEHLDFDEVKNSLGGSPYVGDIVRKGMDEAQAVVVIYTSDEYASLRPSFHSVRDDELEKNRWQPRQNVIFEAGMAMGINEKRTILVVLGDMPLPSDIKGRHIVYLNNTTDSREKFRNLLGGQAVGCAVDFTKAGWHNVGTAGDFEACIQPPLLPEVSTQSPFRQ